MRTPEEKQRRKAYLNDLRERQRKQATELAQNKEELERCQQILLAQVERWLVFAPSVEQGVIRNFLHARHLTEEAQRAYRRSVEEDNRVVRGGAVPEDWKEQGVR